MTRQPRICFYAGVRTPAELASRGWYLDDVSILRELGVDVHVSARKADVPLNCDAYFAWWPTSGFAPAVVATLRRKPFVLVAGHSYLVNRFYGFEHEFGFYSIPAWKRAIVRATLASATATLAISDHVAAQAEAIGARNIAVVPCSVDTTVYRPASEPSLHRTANAPYIISIVGAITRGYMRRKNVAVLVRALPAIARVCPDIRLKLIGQPGDAVTDLMNLAQSIGVGHALEFTGPVTNEQKIALLQGAAAYVQPSLQENFGVATAEAMSCARPVISSPMSAIPEVVGDCGLYADPSVPSTWSEHVASVLRDPDSAAALGRNARNRIEQRFSRSVRLAGIRSALLRVGLEVAS